MEPRLLAIGHRGVAGLAPENTLAGFRLALELGVDGVEFDVHLSRDGVPFVIHDETVDRTTDGAGCVADHSAGALAELDAGAWFGDGFAGETIPTLGDVLDLIGPSLSTFNVELKGDERIEELAEACFEEVVRRDLCSKAVFSSFRPDCVRAVRRRSDHARIGILCTVGGRRAAFEQAAELDAVTIHPHHLMVDSKFVASAFRRGLKVWPWTANNPLEIRRLRALGVDGVISDRPDRLLTKP